MATDCLFREDSYLKSCEARVVAVTGQGGIVLDRTVFYANSGGQPGDTGALVTADGTRYQSKLFNPDVLRSKKLPVPDWLTRTVDIKPPFVGK